MEPTSQEIEKMEMEMFKLFPFGLRSLGFAAFVGFWDKAQLGYVPSLGSSVLPGDWILCHVRRKVTGKSANFHLECLWALSMRSS